jgi:hypothetical protein
VYVCFYGFHESTVMEAKERSASRMHTAENSDDLSKRSGMYIKGEGKAFFSFIIHVLMAWTVLISIFGVPCVKL